jgi:hypothetical protein
MNRAPSSAPGQKLPTWKPMPSLPAMKLVSSSIAPLITSENRPRVSTRMPQVKKFTTGRMIRLTSPKMSATRATVTTVSLVLFVSTEMSGMTSVLSQTARADPAKGRTRPRSRRTMGAIVPQASSRRQPRWIRPRYAQPRLTP